MIFSYKCVCKIWVPIPGTCRQEPFEECVDLAKTKERQVTYPVCEDVPQQARPAPAARTSVRRDTSSAGRCLRRRQQCE